MTGRLGTRKSRKVASAPKPQTVNAASVIEEVPAGTKEVKTSPIPIPEELSAAPEKEGVIELFPFGITLNTGHQRPILVLKDSSGKEVLPVWLNPIDAGLALRDIVQGSGAPHSISQKIFEMLNVRLEKCVFTHAVGHHQYVDLVFQSNPHFERIQLRADEAMSFCLMLSARFFSTRSFMLRSREIDVELLETGEVLKMTPKMGGKIHRYMM